MGDDSQRNGSAFDMKFWIPMVTSIAIPTAVGVMAYRSISSLRQENAAMRQELAQHRAAIQQLMEFQQMMTGGVPLPRPPAPQPPKVEPPPAPKKDKSKNVAFVEDEPQQDTRGAESDAADSDSDGDSDSNSHLDEMLEKELKTGKAIVIPKKRVNGRKQQ